MKTIREVIENIPAGRFFRISYRSELPLKAEYKKQGIQIYKYTTTTSRTGVKYSNIKGVVPSESTRPSYYEWVVKNKIKKNINNGKEYIQLAPIEKGSNKKSVFCIHKQGYVSLINKNDVKNYVIPSYFSKSETPKVITVNLENVVEVKA